MPAMRRSTHFRGDERGIEGLPIRLVIALVVGVASLSVMMQMISGLAAFGVAELDVQPSPEVVQPGTHAVTVSVVGPESEPVADATVVARSGSARLDGVVTARTNERGRATVRVSPELGPNQAEGTVQFAVKPPAGSEYVDRRGNTVLLVVEE